jgi:hypothetical protein
MKKIARLVQIQFFLVLVAAFILPGVVNAGLLCRSDPVVILSNGVTLDIGANINVLPWQVKEVHYELHIPNGVSLVLAIHTPAWLTSQETFSVFSDQVSGQYEVVTTVTTSLGNATVVADTTLVSALNVNLGRFMVSGPEQAPLAVWFKNN